MRFRQNTSAFPVYKNSIATPFLDSSRSIVQQDLVCVQMFTILSTILRGKKIRYPHASHLETYFQGIYVGFLVIFMGTNTTTAAAMTVGVEGKNYGLDFKSKLNRVLKSKEGKLLLQDLMNNTQFL